MCHNASKRMLVTKTSLHSNVLILFSAGGNSVATGGAMVVGNGAAGGVLRQRDEELMQLRSIAKDCKSTVPVKS